MPRVIGMHMCCTNVSKGMRELAGSARTSIEFADLCSLFLKLKMMLRLVLISKYVLIFLATLLYVNIELKEGFSMDILVMVGARVLSEC